ncbi:MAG TPA: hypothetical protein VM328_01210 [Fimbriimonadaceae bacterium]|nr:hypothetical protein [Fimbriimonadaceae bacterium]
MVGRLFKFAGVAALVSGAAIAAAQYGRAGHESFTSGESGRPFENLLVGFQPYVRFKQGSFLNAEGSMFWVEKYFVKPQGTMSIGGWFVFEGLDNAWQVHGKYYPTKEFGFQLGVLGGTNPATSGKYDHTLFVLYEIPLPSSMKQNRYRLIPALGVGAGLYGYSASGDGYKPSGFIQGSINWPTGFAVDASYWIVEGPSGQPGIERLGIGISYRF